MKTLLNAAVIACAAGLALAADEPKKEAPAKVPTIKEAPAAKMETSRGKLTDPSSLAEKAPDLYKVKLETTKGSFTIAVDRSWAPNGADRFYNLAKNGYFEGIRFFRVIPNFMVQFGINGDPALNTIWREARISDDPVKESNKRGYVTFATAGPNTRTTQIFINFRDNTGLDGQGFAPFGRVVEGMDVVDKINSEYGEGAPRGRGPDQGRLQAEGNAYLEKDFPNMDSIKKATIVTSK